METETLWDWSYVAEILPILAGAAVVTIEATLLGFALAAIVGLVLAILRFAVPVMSWPVAALVEFIRSTPLLIQIFFLYFVFPEFGIVLDAFTAGVLALGLHYGAYCSEVYRAGLEAVPRGQMEAARSLGMSHATAMRQVIVPQAVRKVIPPLLNDFIALTKDTALVSVLGFIEVVQAGSDVQQTTFNSSALTAGAILFLLLTIPLARLVDWLIAGQEARFQRSIP
jgi:polar amino acid transport system permease protein